MIHLLLAFTFSAFSGNSCKPYAIVDFEPMKKKIWSLDSAASRMDRKYTKCVYDAQDWKDSLVLYIKGYNEKRVEGKFILEDKSSEYDTYEKSYVIKGQYLAKDEYSVQFEGSIVEREYMYDSCGWLECTIEDTIEKSLLEGNFQVLLFD